MSTPNQAPSSERQGKQQWRRRSAALPDVELLLKGTADLPVIEEITPSVPANLDGSVWASPPLPSRLAKRQLLIWLQEALHPDVSTLERTLRVDFAGNVDPDRFQRAFSAALRATHALRIVVETKNGSPAPSIQQSFGACEVVQDLPLFDWEDAAEARATTPLDLSRQAYESTLFVGDGLARWVLRVHPIVADTWSLRSFANRVARAYSGRPIEVDEAFASFLERERLYRASADALDDAEFWTPRLDATKPAPDFYGVPPRRDTLGLHRDTMVVEREDVGHLARLAETTSTPALLARAAAPVALLATSTLAYLHRVTGEQRVAIGVPIDVRVEAGVGPMTEICPIEVDVETGETFRTLLAKVQAELEVTAPRARHSIDNRFGRIAYDVVLDVLDLRLEPLGEVSGIASVAPSLLGRKTPPTITTRDFASLSIQVARQRGGALHIAFDCADDAFSPARRDVAPHHFGAMLSAMLENLDRDLEDVDLLTSEERAAQAPKSEPVAPPARDGLVPSILANAERFGARTAVEAEDGALDYKTLVERAQRLAGYLTRFGVTTETRVALCLDRSTDLPVAMLATHLAGAAFVPLDPSHPRERTALILEDAAPKVILTKSRYIAQLQPPSGTRIVCLDADREAIANADFVAACATPSSAQLAYILYTSGSTGRPKGVEIEHAALTNLLVSMAESPGLDDTDRLLAVTTPSFDIALLELFLPLYVGARVVIASTEAASNPPALADWIEDHAITVMQATPATWRSMVDAGWEGAPNLTILCGGEALPWDLAEALSSRGRRVFNLYGPTEATIWVTRQEIGPEDAKRVRIGTPLSNTELYVASRTGKLVPDGVAGELWIGGANLARGYCGQEERTARAFIRHPFTSERVVYRTGDLARRREDGSFECLGRLDDQVKIRGFRIELGEIEVAIRAHPQVKDAAVVVREDDRGDRRIVAFLVQETPTPTPFEGHLRDWLNSKLPSYMVPSSFVVLPSLPLTPNGKVDRRVLRPPANLRPEPAKIISPRNDLELQLATIWRDTLDLDEVGVTDSFFELGGHSLHAVTMLIAVRDQLGISIPVATFFETPTIESLAEQVARPAYPGDRASVIALERGGPKTPLFCICGLQLYQNLARALRRSRTVYGVLAPAEVHFLESADPDALPDVEALATEYAQAIRRTEPSGPYALCGASFGGLLAFEVARQLRAQGEEVTSVVLLDAVLERAVKRGPAHWLKQQVRELVEAAKGSDADAGDLGALRAKTYDQRAAVYEAHMERYDGDAVVIRAEKSELGAPVARDLGWGAFVEGTLDVYEVPGSHLGILDATNAKQLARHIEGHLDPVAE